MGQNKIREAAGLTWGMKTDELTKSKGKTQRCRRINGGIETKTGSGKLKQDAHVDIATK